MLTENDGRLNSEKKENIDFVLACVIEELDDFHKLNHSNAKLQSKKTVQFERVACYENKRFFIN